MRTSTFGCTSSTQLPPTPPVDPENVEFVVFVRSKKVLWFIKLLYTLAYACSTRFSGPSHNHHHHHHPHHPLHPRPHQLPKWVPLSIIKGGTSANMLVKSLESDWGNKMFKGQLVNNIGAALYKVCLRC